MQLPVNLLAELDVYHRFVSVSSNPAPGGDPDFHEFDVPDDEYVISVETFDTGTAGPPLKMSGRSAVELEYVFSGAALDGDNKLIQIRFARPSSDFYSAVVTYLQ
jgi:hypothetical protein